MRPDSSLTWNISLDEIRCVVMIPLRGRPCLRALCRSNRNGVRHCLGGDDLGERGPQGAGYVGS
jgi:hypothetical protein